MSHKILLCLGLLLTASMVESAAAQRLRGRLLDLETDEPIPAGILTLLTENGVRLATTVSDQDGYWMLRVPRPGTFLVEAKRIGYQPWIDGPVEIRAGDDWESVYLLRPAAVALDPVEVSAEATERYLSLTGFYERQRANFGHFITREDIERRAGSRVTDVLSAVPGVRLVPTGDPFGKLTIQMRGSQLSHGGICRPRIFVDGVIYNRGDSRLRGVDDWGNPERTLEDDVTAPLPMEVVEPGIDEIVHPSNIAGMEVYRSGAQVPAKFGGSSVQTQCGVIAIWTRVGQLRRRR